MSDNQDCVIVGGGLSGILLALKISLSEKWKNKKITLIEEQATLGGRFFFSSSTSFLDKNRLQIQEELFTNSHENKHLSGFGFEHFNLQTKESLFRHIQNSLTEQENFDLEKYLSQFESEASCEVKNSSWFVRKSWTPRDEILKGSSEFLTKKESEFLNLILTQNSSSEIVQGSLAKAWQELTKSSRESLSQIFSCFMGLNWESVPMEKWSELLMPFFHCKKESHFVAFQRKVALEIFLEKILRARGIQVRTLCKVLRTEQKEKECFHLSLQDEVYPSQNSLQTQILIFAFPLAKTTGILPKEFYSPEQSKFISRIQPLSLVVYELGNFSSLKAMSVPEEFSFQDKLIFPVEQVHAFYTLDDRLLFSTELNFEDSLQAPSVREAVARLKRAASRVLNEEVQGEMKKGFRMPKNQFIERVILVPVAQPFPAFSKINFDLKQVKMGLPNLYCCGDSFFSLSSESWKRVIHSVHNIADFLN